MRSVLMALGVAAALLGMTLVIVRPASGPQEEVQAASAPVQRDGGEGGVEVEVTYVTPEYARARADSQLLRWQPDRYAVFVVAMNTHSVDLNGYDLTRLSELVAGGKTYTPLRWASTSDNNHHRSGALIFPQISPLLPVELRIKNVAGVPLRVFRWTP